MIVKLELSCIWYIYYAVAVFWMVTHYNCLHDHSALKKITNNKLDLIPFFTNNSFIIFIGFFIAYLQFGQNDKSLEFNLLDDLFSDFNFVNPF